MTDRRTNFERAIEDYDEKALTKCVNFDEHRFISIERDSSSMDRYVQGHKTLRGACGHLGRAVEGCEALVPEKVLDLDTGELHELDVFAFVAPKSMDAIALMMPRRVAMQMNNWLAGIDSGRVSEEERAPVHKMLDKALERRR